MDLTGSPERTREALLRLHGQLRAVTDGERLRPSETEPVLTLATEEVRELKQGELLGHEERYRIAGFSDAYTPAQAAEAADAIAERLGLVAVHGDTRVVGPPRIAYDGTGRITRADDARLVGADAFHYLCTLVEQDVALVLKDGDALLYAADISRFEKTPKDPVTGENRMLGRDLLEFHAAARTHGDILPGILGGIAACMERGRLDLLTVDLLGGNVYLHGGEEVRRHERDAFLPLHDRRGLVGILAAADVRFLPTGARPPYAGGSRPLRQPEVMPHGSR